ncbi:MULTISPECIES: DUF2339 domain-containing protein [unclassified Leptotrichia]|uniref:DUF2339 domain-containing protein n=1 Tax=unclassified Leptotrichia TaxID=2633022 RepID=UPI0003AE25E5|nr:MULTISPECIES: DUF2339 domain-containing protein [unclassified Leptotrichia]ERL25810.1 putative ATP synthase F0, A subunit [Leptotrichia sp. oral taxon 225 str. F0581]WLD74833.1 DUF2339 domain-containing protein [Leptotrichia sp. HMT-225]
MINKLKELENLENKYNEIGRINSEIESIIANIKNEAGISREKELLEDNERLAKDLKAFHEKMKVKEEEIGRLKNSNAVLIEELKEARKIRRNGEIDKFQNILAEKMNVELESGVTRRLSNYAEKMKRKVKMLERNLSHEFSDEADSLRDELKKINEKIGHFLEKSNRKTFENKVFLQEESSVFHNKIKEETALKEGEFLFEREKKRFVFEKLIGLKGFNFLGIISIFLGVFLVFRTQFVKILANNYVKSSASYLLGMFFLFTGEKFYQKNKKHFAVGLIGGGIGILYLTTLLSTLYLKLYPMTAGLFISVILTGLVVILSLRYDSQIIGVLSLIGGYLPYGAYIWVNKSNVQIYYVLAYSLILQGIVLGVSWKKDWIYSKIFGFVTGVVNMTGLVYYLNYSIHDKITAFFYIVIFTTAYSFIFLNSHKKENRQSNIIDYIFLSLNLIIKFSLIYSLFDKATPSWLKAILVGTVGIIYGFFGDRLKDNKVAKIFYIVALGSFILIIPLIVPEKFVVVAWGAETALLYFFYRKYKNKEMRYGTIAIYLVSLVSNLIVREEKYLLVYIQDLMIILFSFVLYFLIKQKSYKTEVRILNGIFKYLIFAYSIFFINKVVFDVVTSFETINYGKDVLFGVLFSLFILRTVTYKIKKLQDSFSLRFLVIIEIIYLLFINMINFILYISGWSWNIQEEKIPISYLLSLILLIFVNLYLFIVAKNDIHLCFFKKNEKKPLWILGESIYFLCVANIILRIYEHSGVLILGAGLALDIVGLLLCGYLVWKGFKVPNRNVRRIGLGIGIFFVAKSFLWDFLRFDNSYKLIAYFSMGAILIGTSYIYQTALKKLEQEVKESLSGTDFGEGEKDEENK